MQRENREEEADGLNIREIERQLGIPRANVRYYEKEGLLHPARSANNYRDYSEADAESLRKIQLLRRLDMPIETIRAVQTGEVPLSKALERQVRLLEGEAVRLEQSRALCRSMLVDGTTYAALDPARYERVRPILSGQRVSEPPAPARPPVEGAVWANDRPWPRYWARTFDLVLTNTVVTVALALVFRFSVLTVGRGPVNVLSIILAWALVLALEPLLLSTWGATPGKWLLGLVLRDGEGQKFRYGEMLERTWGVLADGFGLCVPLYRQYRLYKCWRACSDGENAHYDKSRELQYYIVSPDWWGVRAAGAMALILTLSVLAKTAADYRSLLPPNRGEITRAELAENIGDVSKRVFHQLLWVNEEGYELARQSICISVDDGDYVEYVYGEPFADEPVYTVETDRDGFVTALTMTAAGGFSGKGSWREYDYEGDGAFWLPVQRAEVLVWAFAGTFGSGRTLVESPVTRGLYQDENWDGAPVSAGGFTRTAALEMEGYYSASSTGGLMMPKESAESGWFRFTVRLERDESAGNPRDGG